MQRVRRRVLAIAFSLAVLGLVSSGGGGRAATDRTAKVVVITSGVMPEGEGLRHRRREPGPLAAVVKDEDRLLLVRGSLSPRP